MQEAGEAKEERRKETDRGWCCCDAEADRESGRRNGPERPPAAVITLTGRHMFVPQLALITTENNGAEIPELTWS